MIPDLLYVPDWLAPAEEHWLLDKIDAQPWLTEFKRRTQHYGYTYNHLKRQVSPMPDKPAPSWLQVIGEQLTADGHLPRMPVQFGINEYQPGQGIAAHLDDPYYDHVVSLSLGAAIVMEFSEPKTDAHEPVLLAPRSLVVLSGVARWQWRHGIAPRKSDWINGCKQLRGRRVSLTFRTVPP
jgi:alkylated DNA repair dioxygenase AlkB